MEWRRLQALASEAGDSDIETNHAPSPAGEVQVETTNDTNAADASNDVCPNSVTMTVAGHVEGVDNSSQQNESQVVDEAQKVGEKQGQVIEQKIRVFTAEEYLSNDKKFSEAKKIFHVRPGMPQYVMFMCFNISSTS